MFAWRFTLVSWLKKDKKQQGLVGIGLQPDGVCLVCVERVGDGQPVVTLWDQRPLENPAQLDKTLSQLAQDYDLKGSRCTTYLNSGDYWLLVTEAPDVPADELKSAVRWRIKDLIDFHIDDAVLDVFDIPGENIPGRGQPMHAVAARNSSVKQRADVMQAAGIGLEIIDIPEMAQRNLAALLPEDQQGVAMLSMDDSTGLITITRGGEIYLTRNLDIGLSALRSSDDPAGYFERISLEIQRSLDYYDSHFRQSSIRHLVLTPFANEYPELVAYLDQQLDLSARVLKLDELMQWEIEMPEVVQANCLSTLGVALRVEEKVL